jgi:hypothetical protein
LEVEPILRFRRAIEAVTAQITRLNTESQRAAGMPPVGPGPRPGMPGAPPGMPPIPPPRPPGGGAGAGAGAGGRGRGGMGFFGQAAATGAGVLGAQAFQRVMGAGPAMARGQGAVSAAIGAFPVFGPYMEAALSAAQGLSQQYGAYGRGLAPMGGMAGVGGISGRAAQRAQRYGFARPELAQQMGPLAQALGMRGEGVQETVPRLLGLERITGIQAGRMAGIVGAGGIAGEQATPEKAMAQITDVLAAAIESGMRVQDWPKLVDEVTRQTELFRSEGILIQPRSIAEFAAGMSRYGETFRGVAGMRAAGGMRDVMRGAGEKGGFGGMLFMQAAMAQGRSPFEAMMALEDPDEQKKILPAVIQRVSRMGGSAEARAMALRQAMQGKLSYRQALEAVQTAEQERIEFGEVDRQKVGEFLDKERRVTESSRGVARQEASLINERLGAGAGVYAPMKKVERAELQLAKEAAPVGAEIGKFTAEKLTEGLELYKGVKERFKDVEVPRTPGEAYGAAKKDIGAFLEEIAFILKKFWDKFGGGEELPAYTQRRTTERGLGADVETGQTE